jgi:hypothetical protein
MRGERGIAGPESRSRRLRTLALCAALLLGGAVLSAQTPAFGPKLSPLCVADTHTLCLDSSRFSVTADYQQTADGPSIQATAVTLTDATGYFWFFDSSNVELIVKVLDGCALNNHYWVFAAGLTNVGVHMVVTDKRTGTQQPYDNPVGTPFAPIQDTTAFATCP